MRLPVVQVWQAAYDKPYFFAGKGADVAAWRQAARAEMARACKNVSFVALLLDMVKCFERVSHVWLARKAHD